MARATLAQTECERLRYALEFAIEMQTSVEELRPPGYGSPPNTLAWMDYAREMLSWQE